MNNIVKNFTFLGFDYMLFDGDGVPMDDSQQYVNQGWRILGVDYYPNDRTKMTTIFRRPKADD